MPDGRPLVSFIVAVADNGVMGRDNALPWRLSADLKRFKALTMGKPMLMGRRTFDSIGKALPGRTNIVLTRSPDWQAPGVVVVRSVDEALEHAKDVPELAVIGGAEIFRLTLPLADRIHLTQVHANIPGDTVFPALDPRAWREVSRETFGVDEKNEYPTTYIVLERA